MASATRKNEFSPKHVRADCDPSVRELFLVEGESAGGTAKFARDRKFQEILPLKGKILNVMRTKPAKALSSEEVKFILVGLGYDPKSPEPTKNLRVSKLIFLADPDPDGGHINTLLCTLIAKFLPEMYNNGQIYLVYSPEYTTVVDGVRYYGSSVEDLTSKLPEGKKPKNILHIKGWGEVNPDVLSELAFNPETRKLYQVKGVEDSEMKEFVRLMSDDTEYRKKLLGIDFDISDSDSEEEKDEKADDNGRQKKAKGKKIKKKK